MQQAAPCYWSGGPTRQFRLVPSVPSVRPSRPVPSRPVPAEPGGLSTLKTIPPSPVHSGGPGPPEPWILSNHPWNPALPGSDDRAGMTEDTVTEPAGSRLKAGCPYPASRPEPRGPFLRGARCPGVVYWVVRHVYTPGYAQGAYPGVPGAAYPVPHPRYTAHRAGMGLWAQGRRGVPRAGSREAGKQGCRCP